MDASKCHSYMEQFDNIRKAGNRLNPQQRQLEEQIKGAKLLDRVDANILRLPVSEAETGPQWEKYLGCNDYNLDSGNLSVLVGGQDADGEWCTSKMVCYPDGRWLKFETELTSIPNPYYVDPDQPDPSDLPPAGFGG